MHIILHGYNTIKTEKDNVKYTTLIALYAFNERYIYITSLRFKKQPRF